MSKPKFLKSRTDYVKENFYLTEYEEKTKSKEEAPKAKEEEETELVEKDIDGDGKPDVIEVEVEVSSEAPETEGQEAPAVEAPKEEKPIDQVTSTGFSPGFNNDFKQEWAIVKCMTSNGEKIGIEKMEGNECEVVSGNMTYADAASKVEDIARGLKMQIFDNDNDVYLGKVSKAFIRKDKPDTATSYRAGFQGGL